MDVRFEKPVEEGAQVGSARCACGSCHPTATAFREDPLYERHDPRLAEGPCCCGRFFAIGTTEERARRLAEQMSARLRREGHAPQGHRFEIQRVSLPWGAEVTAVVGDLAG